MSDQPILPKPPPPQHRSIYIYDTTPSITVSSQPYTSLTERIHTQLPINPFTK